ncbi:hypothetical protein Tco_0363478 [Tanacetum coccineum]
MVRAASTKVRFHLSTMPFCCGVRAMDVWYPFVLAILNGSLDPFSPFIKQPAELRITKIWEMMLISTHSLWSKYLTLIQENIRPSIVKPEIDGYVKFEINGNFLRELRRKLFEGTDDDDAHEHVQRVLEIVDLFYFTGVTHDAVMLRVFPITLSEPALRWKNRLFAGLITT